jgi:hypothetical protein
MWITQLCFVGSGDTSPKINKRIRPDLKMSGTSYRVDETYIKVRRTCKHLYRAVDKEGNTIEFMLSAKRDFSAAKRFFKKMMRAEHRRLPFSISIDKNASYPEAFPVSVAWQAIIGIGGVILTIHFAYIRFFPDLDWQSSVCLLAVVALTGLLIWSFICLLMVFPSYVWMMFLEDVGEKTDAESPHQVVGETQQR